VIHVALDDDQAIIRAGLARILSPADGFEVVAECADGRQAVKELPQLHPDVVLMDIRMPALDGIAATRHLRGLQVFCSPDRARCTSQVSLPGFGTAPPPSLERSPPQSKGAGHCVIDHARSYFWCETTEEAVRADRSPARPTAGSLDSAVRQDALLGSAAPVTPRCCSMPDLWPGSHRVAWAEDTEKLGFDTR
jgi:CheY-like chemotaxis protein